MKKKLLIGLSAWIFILGATANLQASIIQIDPGSTLRQVNHYEPMGQSFLAEDARVSIAFYLRVINPHSLSSDPLVFSLYEGDGFGGSLLDIHSFSVAEGFNSWFDVDFSSTNLIIDSMYTAGVSVFGSSAYWGIMSGSSYVDGTGYLNGSPISSDNALRVSPVPEPSTFILLGGGLAGLAFVARRRKKE
jgi:hypothetical protein